MRYEFVEWVERKGNLLVAGWQTPRGVSRQVWERTSHFLDYGGDETDLGAARFSKNWDMLRPLLLIGLDPEELISWAKEKGIYEEVSPR